MTYFTHQFRLAFPVIALIAGVVFVSSWATVLATPRIDDGLDQLSAISYGTLSAVQAWAANYGAGIVCVAAIATTLLAVFQVRKVPRAVSGAAFWGGVVTVPLAFLSAPQLFGTGAVVLFGAAAILHAHENK